MNRKIKKILFDTGNKSGLRTALVCAGCMAAVMGTAASAGTAVSEDTDLPCGEEKEYEIREQ